jgi:WD40 repeat protein
LFPFKKKYVYDFSTKQTVDAHQKNISKNVNQDSVNREGGRLFKSEFQLPFGNISAICTTNTFLVVASFDVTYAIVYTENLTVAGYLVGHFAGITCLTVLNGNTVATGSIDQTIRIFDMETITLKTVLYQMSNSISHIIYRATETAELLLTAATNNQIFAWD